MNPLRTIPDFGFQGTFHARNPVNMAYDSVPHSAVEVKLDGLPLEIPAERQTLGGICSYLESVALHQQRILCSLAVDGTPINLTQPPADATSFASIEAETMGLNDLPSQLIK